MFWFLVSNKTRLKVKVWSGLKTKSFFYYSQCPETQRLAGQAGSRPPTTGAGSSGPRCRTLVPGRAPWRPCGPDRNWLPCQVLSLYHLQVQTHFRGKGSMCYVGTLYLLYLFHLVIFLAFLTIKVHVSSTV